MQQKLGAIKSDSNGMKVLIYTDGAARGNLGPSASGYRIYGHGRKVLHETEVYNGIKTNNFAEYNSVILALEWCAAHLDAKDIDVEVDSDSQIVVHQMSGNYKVKAEGLKPLHERCKELCRKFKSVTFKNLPREHTGIREVDRRLNLLLDRMGK